MWKKMQKTVPQHHQQWKSPKTALGVVVWSPWCGFKAVLDNVDEEISPSFQRLDKPKQSMHQVRAYAVKDRVDMSGMSDKPLPPRDYSAKDLLPSTEDMKS
jgi:hypothetical protein